MAEFADIGLVVLAELVRPLAAIMSLIVTSRIVQQSPDSWLHQAIAALANLAID